jgi:hypothetical protein
MVRSILFSVDVLATLAIYFLPKLFFDIDPTQSVLSSRSFMQPSGLNTAHQLQASQFGTSSFLHPSGRSLSSFSKPGGNGSNCFTSDVSVSFPFDSALDGPKQEKKAARISGSVPHGNGGFRLETAEQIKHYTGQVSSIMTDDNITEEAREEVRRLLSSLEDLLNENGVLRAENTALKKDSDIYDLQFDTISVASKSTSGAPPAVNSSLSHEVEVASLKQDSEGNDLEAADITS